MTSPLTDAKSRTLADLLAHAEPGTQRRLSDLSTGPDGKPTGIYLLPGSSIAGDDPLLYVAYRDVLPPLRAAGTDWFADLVVYQAGDLPSGELCRSTGHWNGPAQVEVFEVLTGRVVMLIARDGPRGPEMHTQVCGPGDLCAVPRGGWHLTAVLDGPAAVLNLYADLPGLPAGHGSRRAATDPALKYQDGTPVEVTVVRAETSGFTVTGSDDGLAVWGRDVPLDQPAWLDAAIGGGLGDFCRRADPVEFTKFSELARTHLPVSVRMERP